MARRKNHILELSTGFFSAIANYCKIIRDVTVRMPLIFKNPELTIRQMQTIGIESIPLVIITSIFVGAEVVVQANFQFQGLVPMRYLGFVVSKSMISELAPVITAFVVSSRVSTGIAAELGSMKNSEQLDAMTCLSLDSTRYIIVPKVVAAVIMLPVLVILAEFFGYLASIIFVHFFIDVTMNTYLEGIRLFFSAKDMLLGIVKTAFFGGIIAFSGAYFGLECAKGAEGIGNATTRAVMLAAILILMFDFVVAILFL